MSKPSASQPLLPWLGEFGHRGHTFTTCVHLSVVYIILTSRLSALFSRMRIHVRAHRLHAFAHTRTRAPPAHSRMCARTPPAHARIQACAHAHVQTHTQSLSPSAAQAIAIRCLLTVTVCFACDDADRWLF